MANEPTLTSIWAQTYTLTIIRKSGPGLLLVHLPHLPDNKGRLRAGRLPKPRQTTIGNLKGRPSKRPDLN